MAQVTYATIHFVTCLLVHKERYVGVVELRKENRLVYNESTDSKKKYSRLARNGALWIKFNLSIRFNWISTFLHHSFVLFTWKREGFVGSNFNNGYSLQAILGLVLNHNHLNRK